MTRVEWLKADWRLKGKKNWKKARQHFPICSLGTDIVVLHHKNFTCTNYEEWKVDELVPMFKWCHTHLHPPSAETQKKLIEYRKGRPLTENHKNKIAVAQRKYYKSEEARKIISEKMKVIAAGRRSPMEGKKMSPESVEKMRASKKGKPSKKRGVPLSEEQKKKISQSRKGFIPSEETRKKQSNTTKGRMPINFSTLQSEENKRKRSDALKGRPWTLARRTAYEKSRILSGGGGD
jgi:selenocysteine-specific translation elongation factor